MKEINTEKFPIKLWLDDIEDGAMKQVKNVANLPFIHLWVAVMPDSHQGYGMPIGGVVGLINIISPNMVGVDIGCGMCAVNTHIPVEEVTEDKLKEIMGEIRKVVPVGFNKHKDMQDEDLMPSLEGMFVDDILLKEYDNARRSLGTLGGGNHFIELQKSDEDELWVMIHSGSRNLGFKVCNYYNKKAIELMEKYHIPDVVEQELAYLPVDTPEGRSYIEEMSYCVDFAFENRSLMMDRVLEIVESLYPGMAINPTINIAHNYASLENHMGKNVWVHRKGATRAYKDELGIIPGSMGTKSYIVKGKGNVESFKSCSHGAGRKMGRGQASRTITLEEANKSMEGIVYGRWGKDRKGRIDLGEAPGAYKDLDVVMKNQKDLVEIVTELKPMAVIKG